MSKYLKKINKNLEIKDFDKYFFVVILISTISVLIYNIINYQIFFGYDADAHIRYVNALAMYLPRTFRLPLSYETYEYFSPPVGYIFPAFIQIVCRNLANAENLVTHCVPIYGKFTQAFQSLIFLITIYFYMKSVNIYLNINKKFSFSVLLMISILTVNYRTISMIRGEPYILFFLSIILYLFLKFTKSEYRFSKKNMVLFGICLGLMGLSRQWGLLIFPAFFAVFFSVEKKHKNNYFKFLVIVFFIALIIISPFFLSLYNNYGSITSFNKDSYGFDLRNQPLNFYNPVNQDSLNVFVKPIRGNFDNQVLPILYSDLWGDYWGYFAFTSNYLEQGRNQKSIGDYFARVNLVSTIPTIILIIGFLNLKNNKTNKIFNRWIKYSILFSFLGYMWFLISYPEIPSGDTIKSTYIIQLFHLLSITAAIYLENLKILDRKKYNLLMFFLVAIYFHNLPAMLSHFGPVSL